MSLASHRLELGGLVLGSAVVGAVASIPLTAEVARFVGVGVRSAVKALVRRERDGGTTEYLLLKQDTTGDGDYRWVLPGGGVEAGETQREALAREVAEETSLDVTVGDPADAFTFDVPLPVGGSVQVSATVFACEADAAAAVCTGDEPEAEEIGDAKWVTPDEVADLSVAAEIPDGLFEQ